MELLNARAKAVINVCHTTYVLNSISGAVVNALPWFFRSSSIIYLRDCVRRRHSALLVALRWLQTIRSHDEASLLRLWGGCRFIPAAASSTCGHSCLRSWVDPRRAKQWGCVGRLARRW